MITIFNRKELLITYDMKRQGEVRLILQNHNIPYSVKVKNLQSPSPLCANTRTHTGTLGMDLMKSYEYKIYVKKVDYEKAIMLI